MPKNKQEEEEKTEAFIALICRVDPIMSVTINFGMMGFLADAISYTKFGVSTWVL